MKVARAGEMREIDRLTQEEYGISGDLLMERAALAVFEIVKNTPGGLSGKKILVFCGKGNNGGDGLALARFLACAEADVTCVLLAESTEFQGLAELNLDRALKYGVATVSWEQWRFGEQTGTDLIIDALLGTGASGAPRGNIAEAIERINALRKPVIAIDIPSGIDVDTGKVEGAAVRAKTTVTFGLPKPGLLCYPGAEYTGQLIVESIGFPTSLLNAANLNIQCLNLEEIGKLLPKRSPVAHKGTTGHILVIGGAPGMTGAPALAALGALRSGCGLITVGLRPGLVFDEKPFEVMTLGWPDSMNQMGKFRSVVFGPGLSTDSDGRILLGNLGKLTAVPLVIDADGLNLLADDLELLKQFQHPVVLTPHPGEMARLTGLPVAEIQNDRLRIAQHYAETWKVTVVLKGARTIIAAPTGETYINPTGNPGMASAGMGDVLAGIIGGLIAQGLEATQAAAVGAFLHGLAGDLAACRLGPSGIIASDLIHEIPQAIKKVTYDNPFDERRTSALGQERFQR